MISASGEVAEKKATPAFVEGRRKVTNAGVAYRGYSQTSETGCTEKLALFL